MARAHGQTNSFRIRLRLHSFLFLPMDLYRWGILFSKRIFQIIVLQEQLKGSYNVRHS